MVSLHKALNAAFQRAGRDSGEAVRGREPPAANGETRLGWLRWSWFHIEYSWIQDVPDELAFCEFECRSSECLTGEGCKNPQRPSD
jgi:hypothetical protein